MWIKPQKSSCAHHALECTWTATDRLFPDRSNSKSCRQPNGPARTSNGLTNIFFPKPILQFCFETPTNAIVVHRIYKTHGDFNKRIHLLDRFGTILGRSWVVTRSLPAPRQPFWSENKMLRPRYQLKMLRTRHQIVNRHLIIVFVCRYLFFSPRTCNTPLHILHIKRPTYRFDTKTHQKLKPTHNHITQHLITFSLSALVLVLLVRLLALVLHRHWHSDTFRRLGCSGASTFTDTFGLGVNDVVKADPHPLHVVIPDLV